MSLSYWTLVILLSVVTGGEWALYFQRDALTLGTDLLVPALLALSFAKFATAVWYFAQGQGQGWAKKALVTFLVLAGGSTILLAMLL